MENKSFVTPSFYKLRDLQEFKNIELVNPGKEINEFDAMAVYVRAIHWLTLLEILWPDFEKENYYSVEVASIVNNDPGKSSLPKEFFTQIAEMLALFWKLKLENLYPQGNWIVQIHNDPEITVDATIHERS